MCFPQALQVKDDVLYGIFKEPLFMELAIPLSRNGEPLFRQVYLGLRQAILSATFSAGGRLPSTRDLAEQLGISRTVVVLAYDQLLAEGFVVGRGGSGRRGEYKSNEPVIPLFICFQPNSDICRGN